MTVAPQVMRVLLSLLFIAAFALSMPAQARMYQWVDAESGNVRLSGEPPAWYRSGERAPRVLVFEDGRMVDDTAVVVPAEKRRALREAAFLELDLRREQDAVKKLERAALREARRREEAERQLSAQSSLGAADTDSGKDQKDQAAAPAASPAALDGGMVEQLKTLISDWDKQNDPAKKP